MPGLTGSRIATALGGDRWYARRMPYKRGISATSHAGDQRRPGSIKLFVTQLALHITYGGTDMTTTNESSKQTWTPGPWELTPYGDLIGSNGDKVVFAGDGFSIGSRSNPTWKANGDVAKAAPDLFEALRRTLQLLTDMGAPEEPEDAEVIGAARAALAKATGDQQ